MKKFSYIILLTGVQVPLNASPSPADFLLSFGWPEIRSLENKTISSRESIAEPVLSFRKI